MERDPVQRFQTAREVKLARTSGPRSEFVAAATVIVLGGTFASGTPVPLFQLSRFLMALRANSEQFMDVTPDHQSIPP
jgi:hypothetical protein